MQRGNGETDRQHCRYPWPQGTPPAPPSSVTHPEHRETCLISLCCPLLRQGHLLPKKPPGSRGPSAPSPAAPRHSREGARREPAPGPSCGLGNTAKPAGVTAEIRSGIPGRGKGPNLPCCWRRRHSHRGGRARSCRAKPRPSPAAPRTHGPSAARPRTASQCRQKLRLRQVNDSKRKQQVSALYVTWGLNKNVNTRGILFFFLSYDFSRFSAQLFGPIMLQAKNQQCCKRRSR